MSAGSLFVISAPSGTGKTSLVKSLIERLKYIQTSVSYTTRKPREKEVDGQDYIFVDEATFSAHEKANKFLESAKVFNHYYGTSKDWVSQQLNEGIDVILEIDWQGARIVRDQFPCISIFIIPPSTAELKKRLMARNQDKDTVIDFRMQQANEELSHFDEYDYLVVNDDFHIAESELAAIIMAQRLTLENQLIKQKNLIDELLA